MVAYDGAALGSVPIRSLSDKGGGELAHKNRKRVANTAEKRLTVLAEESVNA